MGCPLCQVHPWAVAGSQCVDTFRSWPSQEHGSVFTVRDFESGSRDADEGGGEAGRRFSTGIIGIGGAATTVGIACTGFTTGSWCTVTG
jgi:hypothetical protein